MFVRKRERVHQVVQWLKSNAGVESCYLEGTMVQAKWNDTVRRLVSGKEKIFVATDVASRGLDIDDVSYVLTLIYLI